MDWFAWLSETDLEPSLVYEYGLLFAQNELEEEDITFLSHDFLQSMGIVIAKHRLEILKLARRERGRAPHIHRLFATLKKTKRRVRKCIHHWLNPQEPATTFFPKLLPPATVYKGNRGLLGCFPHSVLQNRLLLTAARPSPLRLKAAPQNYRSPDKHHQESLPNGKEVWWASLFEDLKPT